MSLALAKGVAHLGFGRAELTAVGDVHGVARRGEPVPERGRLGEKLPARVQGLGLVLPRGSTIGADQDERA
eukprot:3231940-Alexandrium_andersonii.AAC.1